MKHLRYPSMALLCAMTVLPVAAVAADPPLQSLPHLAVDLTQTTVSGFSSGAYMAGQFAVAYSSLVSGAALVAGGPYYCAGHRGQGPFVPFLLNATTSCMNPAKAQVAPPDAMALWDRTRDFARAGLIDDPTHLRRQSIYLFSSAKDPIMTTAVMDQAQGYYTIAGVARLRYRGDPPAGHGFVTETEGRECADTGTPWLNDCDLSLARDLLTFLYPGLKPPALQPAGTLVRFNQRPYITGRSGMADDGYLYVPQSCTGRSCRVHVAFHGCLQDAQLVGDAFHTRAGYNAVADSNDIIVLYPQVRRSGFFPHNPLGCWDYWGYSSFDPFRPVFHTREGIQMRAVRAMLGQLAQSPSASVTRPSASAARGAAAEN